MPDTPVVPPHGRVEMGSDKAFGWVFSIVFLIISFLPVLSGNQPYVPTFVIAVSFAVVSLAKPILLRPFNIVWFKFGLFLHKIVSPIVLTAIYVIAVVPTALALRLLGKDPLRLKIDNEVGSYWIHRVPPGPEPESLRRQF